MRIPPHRFIRLFITPTHPWRRLAGGVIAGLIVGSLMILGLSVDLFGGIRLRLKDALYRPRPTRDIVAIIAIDDASLAAYGRSPLEWDREVYARLIRTLNGAKVRVIAFDMLFAEPSPSDEDVAAAMREARNVIQPILGSRVSSSAENPNIPYDYFLGPTPVLADASRGLGHVNVPPDPDSFVRRIMLYVKENDQPIPSLALAAYLEYLRMTPEMVEIGDGAIRFAGRVLPINHAGQMLISFFGPPSHANQRGSTFPVYSLVDVVEGRVPPEVFSDKIVLVGVLDAGGIPDYYPTPTTPAGEKMFGVEIHANIIEAIHQSLPKFQLPVDLKLGPLPLYQGKTDFPLREQPLRDQMLISFLLAVGAGAILPFLRWYIDLLAVIVLYIAYFFWASIAFTVKSQVFDLLFPAGSLAFTFVGTMIVIYVFEERRRGEINDLFSRYVSPEIAQKIVEAFDHGKLELGGEEREITVLFADVRGFTSLSEGLPPAEVVALLNVFLEEMSGIVMRYGGAINKFIGDNLMAFWNAPYTQDDHAWLATQAGLEMLAAIRRLNEVRRFSTPVQFGIGVNTGPVVVGNIGSAKRLEYTPIGDTVNTASRLCGVAPGGSCYIGVRTRELIGERATPIAVHHLKLKGKLEPVEIHELVPGGVGSMPPEKTEAPVLDVPEAGVHV